MSHDCTENKQTAQNISKRQKSNKTTSSSNTAKSKSEAANKSNNKSFESLLSTGAMSIDDMDNMDNESCANNDWEVSDLIQDSNNDLTDCPEGSNFPTLSKATLIDQDSGEVYQVGHIYNCQTVKYIPSDSISLHLWFLDKSSSKVKL